MSFIVLEQDPFVRADICETLAEAFSGQSVAVAESMDGITDLAFGWSGPFVAVLSMSSDLEERALGQLKDTMPNASFVVIADTVPDEVLNGTGFVYLPRPFSSDSLISAVRTAISDRL